MEEKMMSIMSGKEMEIYPISFCQKDTFDVLLDEISEVTKYISAGSFVGIQVQHREDGISCFAFTDKNGLKKEEMEWLFNHESGFAEKDAAGFMDLFQDQRQVYVVRYKDENVAGLFVSPTSITDLKDLCQIAIKESITVRMMFFSGKDTEESNVLFFLSIPKEISMKGKVYFGNRYPKFCLEKAEKKTGFKEGLRNSNVRKELSQYLKCVAECATELAPKKNAESSAGKTPGHSGSGDTDDLSDFTEDEFDFDSDQFDPLPDDPDSLEDEIFVDVSNAPLEELGLSVRAFNSLKRDGINTIGELMEMSEEDLRMVRNLGLKCFREIQEKLEEYKKYLKVEPEKKENDYIEQLNSLIGLAGVKKQVEKILALAKLKKDMESLKEKRDIPIVLNMVFAGSPGTAKTTVARILAGLLYEAGFLKSSSIVEVGRADLVGKYVGHTAKLVKSTFEEAEGRLLFIDEAYSLVDAFSGDYGDEAINTIVQEMENNRDKTIVIFAGYPDKMKEFLDRNPGLRSRVPFLINFQDYDEEEMVKIVENEAAKRGFRIKDTAMECIRELCGKAKKNPAAGNGRFCRNLVENAVMNYALRLYGPNASGTEDKDFVLVADDFEESNQVFEEKTEAVIGFRA